MPQRRTGGRGAPSCRRSGCGRERPTFTVPYVGATRPVSLRDAHSFQEAPGEGGSAAWPLPPPSKPFRCCRISLSRLPLAPLRTREHTGLTGQPGSPPISRSAALSLSPPCHPASTAPGSGEEAITLPPTWTERPGGPIAAASQLHRAEAGCRGQGVRCAPKGSGSSSSCRERGPGCSLARGQERWLQVHKDPNANAQDTGFTSSFAKYLPKVLVALMRTTATRPHEPEELVWIRTPDSEKPQDGTLVLVCVSPLRNSPAGN